MKKIDVASAALLIVGGLNWGLVAVANFDLVAAIFGLDLGQTNVATRIIYGLVGLAAVYQLTQLRALCPRGGARAATRWRPDPASRLRPCPKAGSSGARGGSIRRAHQPPARSGENWLSRPAIVLLPATAGARQPGPRHGVRAGGHGGSLFAVDARLMSAAPNRARFLLESLADLRESLRARR